MGRKRDISEDTKRFVIQLLTKTTLRQCKIAELAGITKSSVSNIKRQQSNGESLANQRTHHCGRKRITTKREDRIVLKTVLNHRRKSIKAINNVLKEQTVNISTRTLRRRFKEFGIKNCRPTIKQKLNSTMMAKRVAWAKFYKHFSTADWKNVCFSDESQIQIVTERNIFVKRRSNERFHENCITQMVKHPTSVMIWGCITIKGPGPLHIVEGTMNADKYIQLLDTVLVPELPNMFPRNQKYIFQQDGAPCHTAKRVLEYIKRKKIPILDWAGNSPDMNPIENVWAVLKQQLSKKVITTKSKLIEEIKNIWYNDPLIKDTIINSINSMPRRISVLLKNKGRWTKY